jgi:hypothetical protein
VSEDDAAAAVRGTWNEIFPDLVCMELPDTGKGIVQGIKNLIRLSASIVVVVLKFLAAKY